MFRLHISQLGNPEKAADSYAYANMLDKNHWAALANFGAVLHDKLKNPAEALAAYNRAYEILTQKDAKPADPPPNPPLILSQLQYRIGLAITYDSKQHSSHVGKILRTEEK